MWLLIQKLNKVSTLNKLGCGTNVCHNQLKVRAVLALTLLQLYFAMAECNGISEGALSISNHNSMTQQQVTWRGQEMTTTKALESKDRFLQSNDYNDFFNDLYIDANPKNDTK